MQESWHKLNNYSRAFRHHWLQYLILFGGVDLVIQVAIIPFFRLVTTFILQAGEIPFISYLNIITIITRHPLVIASLLLELLVLLLVVYGQFAIILLGVRAIYQEKFHLKPLFFQTLAAFRQLRPGSLVVLLGYFVLVVPFADLVFRTPLLSKVQIPEFILDYLTRNSWLLAGVITFYGVIILLAFRYLFALPLMIYQKQRPKVALQNSWHRTRHLQWWPLLKSLILFLVVTTVVTIIFYAVMICLQLGFDQLPKPLAYIIAVANLTLIGIGSEVLATWSGVITIMLLANFPQISGAQGSSHFSRRLITISVIGLIIALVMMIGSNVTYLTGTGRQPLTISHRGVAEENGVQNTIAAMKKTHHLHPDYVEMDLHETKDHQFVVMHDENLQELAGVNKAPYQLTLRQLTRLTVHENGHKAKIASFDDYLTAAEQTHQKLLVEIKTTPHDSKRMLNNFTRRYAARLIRDHDRVHSLDYTVVEKLKKLQPKLYVMYIQPYNFTYPNLNANGYSMEYSTLTNDFISEAHFQHKEVFAWTVNKPAVMKQMMYDNVDGIITDNLGELNTAIKQYEDQKSYAMRLLNYVIVVPTPEFTGLEP